MLMSSSILVITFNSSKNLSRIGELIKGSLECADEILFIDNASTDSTLGILEVISSHYEKIRIIRNSKNIGYRKAFNQGVRELNSDFIISLNLDIQFKKGRVCDLISVINSSKHCSCALPMVIQQDRVEPYFISLFTIPFLNIHNQSKGELFKKELTSETDICGGPVFIFRREAYLRSGGLYDETFMYNEEPEMSIKMKTLGDKFLVTSKVIVTHEWGNSSSNFTTKKEKHDFFINNWLYSTIFLYRKMFYDDPFFKKLCWYFLYFLKAIQYSIFYMKPSYTKIGIWNLIETHPVRDITGYRMKWKISLIIRNQLYEIFVKANKK